MQKMMSFARLSSKNKKSINWIDIYCTIFLGKYTMVMIPLMYLVCDGFLVSSPASCRKNT